METTLSFAIKPVIRAVEIRQSPNPIGANTGAATLATIKKETGSWKWVGLTAVFQIAVAWVITFAVYHIGLLFV